MGKYIRFINMGIFKCPECDNKYDDSIRIPKFLKCGHTFCKPCIVSLNPAAFKKRAKVKCYIEKCKGLIHTKDEIITNYDVNNTNTCIEDNNDTNKKADQNIIKNSKTNSNNEIKNNNNNITHDDNIEKIHDNTSNIKQISNATNDNDKNDEEIFKNLSIDD